MEYLYFCFGRKVPSEANDSSSYFQMKILPSLSTVRMLLGFSINPTKTISFLKIIKSCSVQSLLMALEKFSINMRCTAIFGTRLCFNGVSSLSKFRLTIIYYYLKSLLPFRDCFQIECFKRLIFHEISIRSNIAVKLHQCSIL